MIDANMKKKVKFMMEVFDMLRGYIIHEDNLIAKRTAWFINLNAFLFTSMAISISDLQSFTKLLASLMIMFAAVGISISYTTFVSVRAANQAIRKVRRLWTEVYEPELQKVTEQSNGSRIVEGTQYLPFLTGGGPGERITHRGRISSLRLPQVIGVSWSVILAVSVLFLCGEPRVTDFLAANFVYGIDGVVPAVGWQPAN